MGFAHRGLHRPGVPENSMAAFRAALELGAGIECDVRLSADGEVVLFHDHNLRRLCASGLAVEATTAEILTRQRLYDSNERIPLLTDLLALAAGQVPLLIELKCRGGKSAELSRAVVRHLQGYSGPVGMMSFEPGVGKWLAGNAPQIRRGLVISRKASAFDRWRGLRVAAPQFLAVNCGAVARPWAKRERRRRWLYSWTIRGSDERETAEIHADALIWEADGRPRS